MEKLKLDEINFFEKQKELYIKKYKEASFMKRLGDANFYKNQIKKIEERLEYIKK